MRELKKGPSSGGKIYEVANKLEYNDKNNKDKYLKSCCSQESYMASSS